MKEKQNGFGAVEGLLILIIIGLIGFTGWYLWHSRQSTDKIYNQAANIVSNTPTANQKGTDSYAGWLQYCSEQEKSCFKYPNDWTLNKTDFGEVTITSSKDTSLVFWSDVSGIGGACNPSTEPHLFYDKVIPVPKVSGLYIVEQSLKENPNSVSIGIRESVNSQPPKVGDSGDCLGYLTFKSHQDSSRIVWFKGGNKTQSAIADLNTAEKILESYYYQ